MGLIKQGETQMIVVKKRGFAALSPERRKEISRLGGVAAHSRGTAHKWTKEEARKAGRKGGYAVAKKRGYKTASC